jgi:predicted RNase H-like HicB family nuclease
VSKIEIEQELDGFWLAEVLIVPGGLAHGSTRAEAAAWTEALALRALAERSERYWAVRALFNGGMPASPE